MKITRTKEEMDSMMSQTVGRLEMPWNAHHSALFCVAYIHLYTYCTQPHTHMGPTQTHTGYGPTRNPPSVLHPHHRPTPPSGCPCCHYIYIKKKKVCKCLQSADKAAGSRLCVCRDLEKMDFVCSDLNSYVVLSGLQHKTFIIILWIEPL